MRHVAFVCLLLSACKQAPTPAPAPAPRPPPPVALAAAWPPDGGEKAPMPPLAEALMRKMANALDGGKDATVRDLFMNNLQANGVLDCGAIDLGAKVTGARDSAVARVASLKGKTVFKGADDGHQFDVRRDGAVGPCKAQVDIVLFRTKTTWDVGGKPEDHDTLLLAVRGAWFFLAW